MSDQPCQPLDDLEAFLRTFIAYPSDAARVAHVLWIAHAHRMDCWESTPRIAFLSPEPGSGKTRALEVTELLVPSPVHAVNCTPAYLFRRVADPAGLPTILYDEIDTLFGPRAKDNEDVRGILNAGHRRGAVAGRCVVKGKEVLTEELPAYCAVALAGLNDLPDTIMSRSVVVRMKRRGPDEHVLPFRRREQSAAGDEIRAQVAAWATSFLAGTWPAIPDGIADRDADVWESLLAVADFAGGDWPERARVAAVTLVTDAKAAVPSLGVRLLADIREVFSDRDHVFTDDLLAGLIALDESPWADLRGKPLDSRSLARRLKPYGVEPKPVRIGDQVARGYERADLFDPWGRYVTDPEAKPLSELRGYTTKSVRIDGVGMAALTSVTSVTSETSIRDDAPPPFTDDDYARLFASDPEEAA